VEMIRLPLTRVVLIKWEKLWSLRFPPTKQKSMFWVSLYSRVSSKASAQGKSCPESYLPLKSLWRFFPWVLSCWLSGSSLQPIFLSESKQIAVSSAEYQIMLLACFSWPWWRKILLFKH
jgi:hypothetical protein